MYAKSYFLLLKIQAGFPLGSEKPQTAFWTAYRTLAEILGFESNKVCVCVLVHVCVFISIFR